MKKRILVIWFAIVLLTCLTGCDSFGTFDDFVQKPGLGERYDSDKIIVSEESLTIGKERLAKWFAKYNEIASQTQFVVHENTAIAIAEAVIKEIYPDDGYGVVYFPVSVQASYYKAENCWEVTLYKNAKISEKTSELDIDDAKIVYVDVKSGAIRAIIPAPEFSVQNPANSD